jgi:hypothetical protein
VEQGKKTDLVHLNKLDDTFYTIVFNGECIGMILVGNSRDESYPNITSDKLTDEIRFQLWEKYPDGRSNSDNKKYSLASYQIELHPRFESYIRLIDKEKILARQVAEKL